METFAYTTDIHADRLIQRDGNTHNYFVNTDPFNKMVNKIKSVDADYLILCGDTARRNELGYFLRTFADQFKNVLIVYGNHEYENTNMDANFEAEYPENVVILKTGVVFTTEGGKRIIGDTLWTDPHETYEAALQSAMPEYSCVYNGRNLCTFDTKIWHEETVDFIQNNLDVDIVVTHHAPTWDADTDLRFKGSILNHAFYSANDQLIHDTKAKYWFFGHTHRGFERDYSGTLLINSPYSPKRVIRKVVL